MKTKISRKKSFKYALLFASLFLMFFAVDAKEASAADNWRYEGVSYYVPTTSTGNKPVYRFYSPNHRAHFFTISATEKNRIISNYPEEEWRYEGIAYYVPTTSSGNKPVYRFYSTNYRTHFFTTSANEKNRIVSNYPEEEWRYEGIAYYVPTTSSGNKPVYRFFNTTEKAHFFTISESEKTRLLASNLGPEISVGIWSFTREELRNEAFEIEANKNYVVKDNNKKIIGTINKSEKTKVKYDEDGKLKVYDTIKETLSDEIVYFEAADGDNTTMIFDVHLPGYDYDEYRGKIRLDYSEYIDPNPPYEYQKRIWVINALPLEHYVWGDGELTGTGDMNHNKVMVTSFRSYGYWWIDVATKWRYRAGFIVDATPGNQLYRGYEYEEAHPRVRRAAEETRGQIVTSEKSDEKDGVAITPYSSWTDGRTRSFEEKWGSTAYPWCQSVDDPYGDYNGEYWSNSYKSTSDLVSAGNHMVGLSAHGSVTLANEKGWSWDRIIKYYFDGVEIKTIY